MPKARRNRTSSVDAGECFIFGIAAQFQRLFNDRCKVLLLTDVCQRRIGHHRRSKYPVSIACFRRHKTVGCEKNRGGDICKFLLLILPCRTEVTFQVRILSQFRVSVRRQHLPVGIDVNALALCLLQQQFQVV